MGNANSTCAGRDPGTPTKICYYELLEVEETCSEEDIKKAYKRKALELHPDKNINDIDNATRRFAEVQAAYEVLSDPHERAWYDAHREQILQGVDGIHDHSAPAPEFRNVRITSVDEIHSLARRFNTKTPFTDEPAGFFGCLREMFDHLALEETIAGDFGDAEPIAYPSFGMSNDQYEPVVKPFYSRWSGFATRKTFTWKDKYRLSDAVDRKERRWMEKENRKCRDTSIREFNEAVRFLVAFARKRDPRYLPNFQSDAERQEALRAVVAAQAARSRAANKAQRHYSFVALWAQPRKDMDADDEFPPESESNTSGVERDDVECLACDKIFKSERQYEAHEKSKKHRKAIMQLRRQLVRESEENGENFIPTLGASKSDAVLVGVLDESHHRPEIAADETKATEPGPTSGGSSSEFDDLSLETASQSASEDSDYASRDVIVERIVTQTDPDPVDDDDSGGEKLADSVASVDLHKERSSAKKQGKAKARREKKAARKPIFEPTAATNCAVCDALFPSRTKLFAHIREKRHAAPRSQEPFSGRGPSKSKNGH